MNAWILQSFKELLPQLGGMAFGSLKQTVFWLGSLVLHQIGWGGVAALVAASLLLLSLSARAIKFITSPRGMAVSMAVMLIGLFLSWYGWSKGQSPLTMASQAGSAAAESVEPPPPLDPLPPEPEIELAEEEPEEEAEAVAKAKRKRPDLPVMPILVTPEYGLPLMPMPSPVTFSLNPPMVVGQPAASGHLTLPHGQSSAPAAMAPTAKQAGPAAVSRHVAVQTPQLVPTPYGHAATPKATPARHGPTPAQRAMAAHQTDMILNQAATMMHQLNTGTHPLGGGHPMGMHPMGGPHHGTHPGGMGHPQGGTHHPGGHH